MATCATTYLTYTFPCLANEWSAWLQTKAVLSWCLIPDKLWNRAPDLMSVKTNYVWRSISRHTHTQAVTNNNEVFQLCFVTCDLITAFSHHGDRLRSGSPISLNFLTSINCVCCSPFLDVSCVRVCVIYLTTPPGLPIVSAFKHSHGNQTQPNPYRCPGMCEYNTVSTTETGQTHTNTHFLCVRAVYFHLWVPWPVGSINHDYVHASSSGLLNHVYSPSFAIVL